MAEDISELVVKVSPSGMDETNQELDQTRENFQDTADDVGESTGMLSDFASKFKGAGLIFAGAFGTMVAAIASKMPILRETASGMDAVLTALGLKMDKFTRDRLSVFNRELFRTADAINEAEGPLDTFLALVQGLDRAFTKLAFGEELGEWVFQSRLTQQVISELSTVVSDTFSRIAGDFEHFVNTKIPALKAGFSGIVDFLKGLKTKVKNALINNVFNPAIEIINRLINKINQLPGVNIGTLGTLETVDEPTGGGGAETAPSGPSPSPGVFPGGPALASGGETVSINTTVETNVDGRKVAEETKPFTVRGALGRGRGARMR